MSKFCTRCKTTKPLSDFYRRRNNKEPSSYCKPCTNNQTLERQRAFKIKIVNLKGGKCSKCGYNKCVAALEFHHLDPNEKDFHFSQVRLTNFEKNKEKILKELNKCILVCSNCHREIHWNSSVQI